MNIAIVTPEFVSENLFDGGLANYTFKLAKWLMSKGHSVVVYLLNDDIKENETIIYEGIELVKVSRKDYNWFVGYYLKKIGLGFLYTERIKFKIKFWQRSYAVGKIIKSNNKQRKIDIIHYPQLGGYANHRIKKIPTVVRISGSSILWQKMGGFGDSDLQTNVLENFEIKGMKKADAVFGPSKMITSLTEPLIRRRIEVFETPYLKPEKDLNFSVYEEKLSKKKYILFFGSIGLIKGVGVIAEIIHSLLNQHTDLYYVFVGKHQKNTINDISVWDYLIDKAGQFKDRIIYLPSQKHEILFPIIQHAELITLPSRIDNFPNTCIESMANRKIVIGTKGNGFDQLITNGENGFIIDVDDSQMLLNKINHVLNLDLDTKNQIENKAFERVNKLHPDIVFNQLIDFYKKTINDKK